MYQNRTGESQNFIEAFSFYRFACESEYMRGCSYLGEMYESERLRNYEEAFRVYQITCEGEDIECCERLIRLCSEHPINECPEH